MFLALAGLGLPCRAEGFDAPLQVSQYAHTSWTARDGASLGLVFAITQTPDGYLWVGGSFGLFRFDGLRFMPWQPPDGQPLPGNPYALLVSRDGALWIGTFNGLARWNGKELTRYPQIGTRFVTSLLEDRDGTVWAGVLADVGQLCAIRGAQVDCTAPAAGFGTFVWSLAEDRDGALWAGAETGLWRWKPGAPHRIDTPGMRLGDLTASPDGRILAAVRGAGLRQASEDRLEPLLISSASQAGAWLADRDVKANKLLRDRDGGLWIGTEGLGIIHVKDGQADAFTRADGLSGDIACSLFEDREGNIWFSSEKGLDRFRKLPVTSLSISQGLPDVGTNSVLTGSDGSVWVGTNDGLARWQGDKVRVYREREGLPGVRVQSLYEDADHRLWVSASRGLAYLRGERFVAVPGVPGKEVYSMTGDAAGNLWLSTNQGLSHLRHGRLVETIAWAALGRRQQAKVIVADGPGLWLSFWEEGGVLHVQDGQVDATYTTAQGLGAGHVSGLRLDADGAIWAATENGGLSRIKDGRITTLSVASGLPCNAVHWSTTDDQGSLWMYASCGLLQVGPNDLAAWLADPAHRIAPKLWGGADGVPLMALSPAYFNPPVARAADGKLWFVSGADVQVVAPGQLAYNPLPPPVHIESLEADHVPVALVDGLQLAPLVRDVTIEFAALSLVDPKNTRFRYRLEGHDDDWQEVFDRREAAYTNLPPGQYRFRVKAANNSGVWNEQGAQLAFSILPAFYQTAWFRMAAAALSIGLAWLTVHLWWRMRIQRLRHQFESMLDARVAERMRIARDLHDTLLQSFHGLLLHFQAALNLLPARPADAKQVLARAIDQAAEAITEGRDTVQGLRASTLETNNLGEALLPFAQGLAAVGGGKSQVHLQVHGTPRGLHPLVRDEAFRIASEALRNAFHHAHAKHVNVDIHYDAHQLRVTVRDDGDGIDPQVLREGERAGHYGLRGMRERAAAAGGKIIVRSELQAGTEVEFVVSGSQAYSRPRTA